VADNATGSPQLVALKGTATAPLTVTLTPATLTFASTVVGATSAAQVVTIKNTGTAAVALTSETFTGANDQRGLSVERRERVDDRQPAHARSRRTRDA